MIYLVVFVAFIASFFIYHTSKKTFLGSRSALQVWIQNNSEVSKILAITFYCFDILLSINTFGITSGIIYSFLLNVVILSLIIILAPLHKINYKHLFVFFSFLFIIQIVTCK